MIEKLSYYWVWWGPVGWDSVVSVVCVSNSRRAGESVGSLVHPTERPSSLWSLTLDLLSLHPANIYLYSPKFRYQQDFQIIYKSEMSVQIIQYWHNVMSLRYRVILLMLPLSWAVTLKMFTFDLEPRHKDLDPLLQHHIWSDPLQDGLKIELNWTWDRILSVVCVVRWPEDPRLLYSN